MRFERLEEDERIDLSHVKQEHIPTQMTWKNLSCILEQTSGPPCRRFTNSKQILQDVNGFAKPGSITAIIGSSGAGKSTLLDILSGRKNIGNIGGDILVNGRERNYLFKRVSAYVTQEDILLSTLTVYETLMLHVKLKIPREGKNGEETDAIRHQRVMDMIEELGLEKVMHVRVGDENMRGISGGEKKRLCIGCEMISDPSLLFLDEPTTGLDAFNSQQVMFTLRKLAAAGRTIICTLHQPRSSIFAMFDYLLCLSEGRIVYFGEAKGAVGYFERELNELCPAYFNPADFIIDLALEDENRRFALLMGLDVPTEKLKPGLPGDTSCADVYARSALCHSNLNELESLASKTDQNLVEFITEFEDEAAENSRAPGEPFVIPEITRFAIPWPYQFAYLMERQLKTLIRIPQTSVLPVFMSIFMGLFLGSLYHGTMKGTEKNVENTVTNTEGVLFFCIVNLGFNQIQSLFQFVLERKLFMKENAAGMYHVSAYYLTKNLSDIPSLLFGPIIFCPIIYYLIGFRPGAQYFFTFVAVLLALILCMCSFFVFFGALCKTPELAQIIAFIPVVIFLLTGGFYVNVDTIPVYYIWLQYISPFKYSFSALLQNELKGNCLCDNVDPNNCPYECLGDKFLFCEDKGQCLLGSNYIGLWNNVFILLGYSVIYRLLGYIALRFIYKQQR